MKIIDNVTVSKIETKVTQVICDRCGDPCRKPQLNANDTSVEVKAHGCYDSAFPPDMHEWTFDICEYCFAAWIATFRSPPEEVDRVDLLNTSRSPQLDYLMTADPGRFYSKHRGLERRGDLEKVMEKIRLPPGPLVQAAMAMKRVTVEDLLTSRPSALPLPARSYNVSFGHERPGVYVYKARQIRGNHLPDKEGIAEVFDLILKTFEHARGAVLKSVQVHEGYSVSKVWEFHRIDKALRDACIEADEAAKRMNKLYIVQGAYNEHRIDVPEE